MGVDAGPSLTGGPKIRCQFDLLNLKIVFAKVLNVMKALSKNLQFTLKNLAGTRTRFGIVLVAQVVGFVLNILHLGLNADQIINLGLFGLYIPILMLITLRQVVEQLQKPSQQAK